MKKYVICTGAALLLSIVASADVMSWQVPTSVTPGTVINSGGGDLSSWTYAVLRATTEATSEAAIYGGTGSITETTTTSPILSSYVGSDTTLQSAVGKGVFDTANVVASLGSYGTSAYSFYVELYDASNTLIGFSSAVKYDNLLDYIASDIDEAAQLRAINGSWGEAGLRFTVVPEPTSGVMLLLGAALLGLRRRRIA